MPFDPASIPGLQLRLETLGLPGTDGDVPASWTDSTPNAIVGTNHGAVYRTGAFYGQPGFEFNGTTTYIDLGTPAAIELYDHFTIFVVIKTATDPGASPSFVLSKDDNPFDKGYGLGIAPGGPLYMDFGGNDWFAPSGPSLIDGAPHILRLSYASISWKPAVDGVRLVDFASAGPLVDPSEPWQIGRCARSGDPRYYEGLIAAILVYDSVLSDADNRRVETYLFDNYVPPPAVPIPYDVQIGPSGEDVIIGYRMLDGTTPAKVIGTTGGITLNVNGTPITPSTWTWCNTDPAMSNYWLFGTLRPEKKYAVVADNEDATRFVTTAGTWEEVQSSLATGIPGEFFLANNTVFGLTYHRSNSADATGVYTVAGLTPGPGALYHSLYDILDADRTTDAVYTVRDGSGTLLGEPAHLDQTALIGPYDYDILFYNKDHPCKILLTYTLAAGQDTIVVTVTNGAGAGYLVCDALIVKSISAPIAVSGDTVTIDIPANSVTVDGLPTPRDVVGREVTFATDNDIAPFDPDRPRTMLAGTNKEPSGTNALALMAANRGYSVGGWSGAGDAGAGVSSGGGTVAVDDLGEIVSLSGTVGALLWETIQGTPTVNDGDVFRLEFDYTDGDFDDAAKAGQTFACANDAFVTKNTDVGGDGYESLGGTRWRLWFTYHAAPWTPLSVRTGPYSPVGVTRQTWFLIDAPIHNLSFFDKSTPVGDTRYAHPTLHDRFGGTGMIWRFMDALNTNGSTARGVSDYWPEAAHWRSPSNKATLRPVVTRIRGFVRDPATDPDHVFDWSQNPPSSFYAIVVVEVDSTTGMVDGRAYDLTTVTDDFPPAAGGSNPLIHVATGIAYAISPTAALLQVGYGGGPDGSPMPASIADGADWVPDAGTVRLTSAHATDTPVILAKCARELGLLPYYTLPYELTDAGAVEFAHMAMDHSDPGTKVRFEFYNEVWNSISLVQPAYAALALNLNKQHADNPDAQPLTFRGYQDIYVWKSNYFRQLIKAEFVASGRGGDLVWIMGSQAANSGVTGTVVTWGAMQSPPVVVDFDEMCIDGYQDNGDGPLGLLATTAMGGLDEVYDHLGAGGYIDLLTLCAISGNRALLTAAHRDLLDTHGFGHVKLVVYEGLWNALALFGTVEDSRSQWAQVILRHPRMYHLTLAYLQSLDELHYGFFCRYFADNAGGLGELAWCDYSTPTQRDGTGSPSENVNPWDVGSLVSQTGGALKAWALGVTTPTLRPGVPLRKLRYRGSRLRVG